MHNKVIGYLQLYEEFPTTEKATDRIDKSPYCVY